MTSQPDLTIDRIDSASDGSDDASALSRRTVLRSVGSVLAAGGASAAVGSATTQDRSLTVETTDVEILDGDRGNGDHRHGADSQPLRTTGRISGMEDIGCERCELGAQVKPVGHDSWYGGVQTVRHTPQNSMRVTVTVVLSNVRAGKYECRLCARPILGDAATSLSVGNTVTLTLGGGASTNPGRDDKDSVKNPRKLRRAAQRRCPCSLSHPNRTHLTVAGGGGDVRDYLFRASRRDVSRVGASAAPRQISDRHVTVTDTDDYVAGRLVAGTVAGGGDSFLFSGELTDVQLDPGISLYVHGTDVTDAVAVY